MLRRVATVAILLLAACGADDDASPSPTSDASTTSTVGESAAVETIDTGAGTCSMARSGDHVWVAALQANMLLRVSVEDRSIDQRVEVAGAPCWLVADDESVWVAPSESAEVIELDAVTGQEVGRVEIGDAPADPKLLLAAGSLWATVTPSGEVVRIDDGEVTARIPTGADPRALLEGDGLVWVANETGDTITAIDPATNEIARTLEVPNVSMLVTYDDGVLWVGRYAHSDVLALDPETGETIRTVDDVGNASPGLVRDGQVWIPDHLVSSIAVVDGDPIPVGEYPSHLLAMDDEVWVASYGDGVVEILE